MKSNQLFSFYTLIVLFFLWGFLTSLNDILVPHLKAVFELKNWQAQLIQFFFFAAYFVMSIPAGIIIRKIGYRKGIVVGLLLMGIGCFIFYPASIVQLYGVFLSGLFVLASGITILQVAANPYVAVIGPEETAAGRLNLAQGFNSLGHTLAPLFGAWLILQNAKEVSVETVQLPYILLSVTLIIIGVIFYFIQLPEIENEDVRKEGFNLWRYPHLVLGAIAIFCYVGAEISIGSFLVEYFKTDSTIAMENKTAGSYVAFYWGGAMIGRFLGAIALGSNTSERKKAFRLLPIPLLAILIVGLVLYLNGQPFEILTGFSVMVLLNYLAFVLAPSTANRLLAVFALCCMALLSATMLGSHKVALWAVLGVGLFNSIMWSNIFTLAIAKLKEYTTFGSSLLVMMILGGALIPLLQGVVADFEGVGIKYSFIVPFLAYSYLFYYGIRGYQPLNE